ncbi:aminotransferase class V-fold PLP-dependent enzyme [Dongia soli]|uniref:Cysteine desulfurase n=1 Tax=Dongia soli TaxID=600628 RepID=A0ABU5EFS9_9PROT|nr:SufS family cysteine desulfurase [Dongia soli]MDY0885057.1 SufS family cysteine desulfurase [Dongia soli]
MAKITTAPQSGTISPLIPREAFPLLANSDVAGRPVIYLDSAASAQKPAAVLQRQRLFYETGYANIHRGVYPLSDAATEAYEAARRTVAGFLHAAPSEIVFTRSATESINLVANSYATAFLREGDEILISLLEHHANFVPWQAVAQRHGFKLRVAPISESGDLDLEAFPKLLSSRTKLVCLTAAANTLGTVTPLQRIIPMAHQAGAKVLVDAAQAAPHGLADLQQWDCDFLALTGHKLYGPDGIGILFGKADLLAAMPPWQLGGDMIRSVRIDGTDYAEPPQRFEAGTPPIGAAIGLAAAIDFFRQVDPAAIREHDQRLLDYALDRLGDVPGLTVIGRPAERVGILSFTMEGIHPHDAGSLLGAEGICVRTGFHCAQPLMDHLGLSGTIRASFGLYTGSEDIDRLVEALEKVRQILR